MSIGTLARGPGTALWMVSIKPAQLGLEEQLLGLVWRTIECLRLPHIWGLVQCSPVAQMDEATMYCVETGEGEEHIQVSNKGLGERQRQRGKQNPGSAL